MHFLILIPLLVSSYKPLSYSEIHQRFQLLSENCPFLSITTAQAKYGLAYPSDCNNCSHLIVTIGNSPLTSVPQIYFSGCLHGDERIGPVVLTELASYLCSEYSKSSWIKRIVDTHLIIMTPTTNAQGYHNFHREETINKEQIDPNRDFPFDNKKKCGQSLTSQVVIHLFQSHLFRAGITFHSGELSLTYPWGAFLHYKNAKSTEAPDLQAFKSISKSLLAFSKSPANVGTMNDVVYPVNGGLEDWAYGGGWDTAGQSSCGVNNFSNPEGLKQVFFLLEASRDKNPEESVYGSQEEVDSETGGLVPQYIRMSLALVDLTEPYIQFKVSHMKHGVMISWEVWGAITVSSTQVYYSSVNRSDWTMWEKTEKKQGGGRWGTFTKFTESFNQTELFFVIVAQVDQWVEQSRPDPDVRPQTHMVRIRTDSYMVEHNGFQIVGSPIVKTKMVSTSELPNLHLRALFGSKLLEVLDFGEFLEVRSEIEVQELRIYEFGDSVEGNSNRSLMEELCNVSGTVRSGVYKGCKSSKLLAGRFVMSEKNGISVFESDPPVNLVNYGLCTGEKVKLALEKYDENIILVSAEGDFEEINLDINWFKLSINRDEKVGGKFFYVQDSKVVGGKFDILVDGEIRDSCQVVVSRVVKRRFDYTKIELPVWAMVIVGTVKVIIVVWVLYKRCYKKKNLKVPKYEEIELVFSKK